jgi:undecaprenyl-diphosphatase
MSRAVAVGAGLVLVMLVAWVSIEGAVPFDRRLLVWVHDVMGTGLDDAARIVARGATAWVLVPVAVAGAGLLVVRRQWAGVILVVAGAFLVWVVNPALKQLVRRERPAVRPPVESVSEFSFPSGHATAATVAAAIVVALAWNTRVRSVALVIGCSYVVVIVCTQLVLGVHHPSDLVAGCALGLTGVAGTVWALRYCRLPGETTPDS